VTQPYDKITAEMRQRYLSLSPYNLVRVILGERSASDSERDNVYTRAAKHLEEWIRHGILERDAEPGFYAYFQEFDVPEAGERAIRKGFIGLGAVEDYSQGVVHRHEETLTGPKQDRLELLRHTRAHFGQIFMLYPDRGGEVDAVLDQAAAGPPAVEVQDGYGAAHRLWRISETDRIGELMKDKRLLIADGHHRYETALAFRNEHPEIEDAGKVMMTFVNLHSPGLKILPTHRVVYGLRDFDARRFLGRAKDVFDVTPVASVDDLRKAWAEEHESLVRIGAALPDGLYLFETARSPGVLDVRLLHQGVLENLLSIGESEIRAESHLRYLRGLGPAVEAVRRGEAQAAFLLEAPKIDEVAQVAFSGGVMPQKSTDFYPKLLSGLTIYRLDGGY
jgi:uncharacterized protein (DUF1015 family)